MDTQTRLAIDAACGGNPCSAAELCNLVAENLPMQFLLGKQPFAPLTEQQVATKLESWWRAGHIRRIDGVVASYHV